MSFKPYYNRDSIDKFRKVLGFIYVVELQYGKERFTKVGITTNMSRRKPGAPHYKIVREYAQRLTMFQAWHVEQHALTELAGREYYPIVEFGGWTECTSASHSEVVKLVQRTIKDEVWR